MASHLVTFCLPQLPASFCSAPCVFLLLLVVVEGMDELWQLVDHSLLLSVCVCVSKVCVVEEALAANQTMVARCQSHQCLHHSVCLFHLVSHCSLFEMAGLAFNLLSLTHTPLQSHHKVQSHLLSLSLLFFTSALLSHSLSLTHTPTAEEQ